MWPNSDHYLQVTSVTRQGEGKFKVAGDLTLYGVTKPVISMSRVDESDQGSAREYQDRRRGHDQDQRSEFGLTWNRAVETGGVAVSDEVAIVIDLELVKKAPPAAATSGGSSK